MVENWDYAPPRNVDYNPMDESNNFQFDTLFMNLPPKESDSSEYIACIGGNNKIAAFPAEEATAAEIHQGRFPIKKGRC